MADFNPGDKIYTSRYAAQYIVRECVVVRVSSLFVYCRVGNSVVKIHRDDVFRLPEIAEEDVRSKVGEALKSARLKVDHLTNQLLQNPPLIRARK